MSDKALVLASTLSHVHVGVGRSEGVVDLPVIRDSSEVFFLPASSIKGSMKTALAHKLKCEIDGGKIKSSNTGDCKKLLCYFGSDEESGKGASKVTISDFYPLLVPVGSLDEGLIYVTSKLLWNYFKNILLALGKDSIPELNLSEPMKVSIGIDLINAMKINNMEEIFKKVIGDKFNLKDINPVLEIAKDRSYLIEDKNLSTILNRATIKLTRVRLDRKTKSVQTRALWTEEYVPMGTLFAGMLLVGPWENDYCHGVNASIEDLLRDLFKTQNDEVLLVIGGKETIGKGLLKLNFYTMN